MVTLLLEGVEIIDPKSAWFKSGCFWVTLRRVSLWRRKTSQDKNGMGWERTSVLREPPVAEHLQPMRMLLVSQELGRTLAHTAGTAATLIHPVIQEES